MTFEEFFNKKKIDLLLLKRAEPTLYEEFRSHYEQMGEKSFDHTKKFWFNRLRKDYLLNESSTIEPNKIVVAAPAVTTPSRDLPTSAVAPPPKGFKPRFKAGVTKPIEDPAKPESATEESDPEATQVSAPETKPMGFKPRFKANVTKPTKPTEEAEKPENPTEESTLGTKPLPTPPTKSLGFKPRFKAGVTKAKDQE